MLKLNAAVSPTGAECRDGYSAAIVHDIVLQKAARQISAMRKT